MKDVEIFQAVDSELLERCLHIRNQVFTLEKGIAHEMDVDRFDCLGPLCSHFLIRYREHDVGTIRFVYLSRDTVQIQRFCFLKAYRGLGLGKAVMQYSEAYYQDRGFSAIELDAKYEARGFYEKCGYQTISDVFMEVNVAHVKMRKTISAA